MTEITKSHHRGLPPLPAYREHLDRRLPDVKPAPSPVIAWIVLVVLSVAIGAMFAYFA